MKQISLKEFFNLCLELVERLKLVGVASSNGSIHKSGIMLASFLFWPQNSSHPSPPLAHTKQTEVNQPPYKEAAEPQRGSISRRESPLVVKYE